MTLPDALVEKAARAIAIFFKANKQPDMSGDPFAKMLPHQKRDCFDAARAALEAAAPSLRAEGMEEAKKVAVDRLLDYDELAAQLAMTTILACAAEIEGEKG